MAKIFRTESLSVNGDNIRLTSASADTYKLTTAAGATIMDKTNADIDSDVSSLQAKDVANTAALDSDVSSLSAIDTELDTDVSSLQAKDVANTAALDSDVSSLSAIDTELDSDVSSLAAKITTNDVQVSSTALSATDTNKTITFGTEFGSTPSVVGSLKSSSASDPIIACQMSAISTTAVTFQFSDDIPNGNYTLEILASI